MTASRRQAVVVHNYAEDGYMRVQHDHRVAMPLALFRDDAEWSVRTRKIHHPDFAGAATSADLVVLHEMYAPEIEALIRWRHQQHLPTLYAVNDQVMRAERLEPDHRLRSPLTLQYVFYHIHISDGLQVSASGLAKFFSPVHTRIQVLENWLPVPPEFPVKPPGFVFGWGGTISHEADIAAMAPAVVEFCRRHPDAVFAFIGNAGLAQSHFGALPPAQLRRCGFVEYGAYLDLLKTWHVGLAPLLNSPFNSGRTDVKFSEYAASGTAAVLSDHPVYRPHADRALLFRTFEDMLVQLEALYADRTLMTGVAQRAFKWVQNERSADAMHSKYRAWYDSFVPASNAPNEGVAESNGHETESERFIQAAEAYQAHEYESSLAICAELLKADNEYAIAQYLLARNMLALERYADLFELPTRRDISPLYHDLVIELQISAARRVAPAEVQGYIERIESPWRKLRLQADRFADKLEYYRRLLAENPYDFFAVFGALRLLRKKSPDDPAVAYLRARAELLAPEALAREEEGLAVNAPSR